MRIGMVCPYSFDVPGGVQAHVVELAQVLIERGHKVSVLAPAADDTPLPDFVVSAGKAVAIPYNGSVARLSFGPDRRRRPRPCPTGRRRRPAAHDPIPAARPR
ncbi:glycosyltransferase, partial [Nocardia sp. NPDC004722]